METKNGSRRLGRDDLIYPETSYTITGILFDVSNTLGYGHPEKIYQRAVAEGLRGANLEFGEQVPAKMLYQNKPVGIYYFDFLIENKIILELKKRNYFSKKDIEQIYAYLKARDLKLGILAHFTRSGVKHKRIVNID